MFDWTLPLNQLTSVFLFLRGAVRARRQARVKRLMMTVTAIWRKRHVWRGLWGYVTSFSADKCLCLSPRQLRACQNNIFQLFPAPWSIGSNGAVNLNLKASQWRTGRPPAWTRRRQTASERWRWEPSNRWATVARPYQSCTCNLSKPWLTPRCQPVSMDTTRSDPAFPAS